MNKEEENERLAKFDKGSFEWLQEKELIRKEKAREYYYKNIKGIDPNFFSERREKETGALLEQYAGKIGRIKIGYKNAWYNVRVLNVKKEYGNLRFFVEPIDGEGQFWTQKVLFSSIG